jgi:hypothetical protein
MKASESLLGELFEAIEIRETFPDLSVEESHLLAREFAEMRREDAADAALPDNVICGVDFTAKTWRGVDFKVRHRL